VLLADVGRYREVGGVHLLWGVPTEDDVIDIDEVMELAGPDSTVLPVVLADSIEPLAAAVSHGDWTDHEVYVTGESAIVEETVALLTDVPAERIHRLSVVADADPPYPVPEPELTPATP